MNALVGQEAKANFSLFWLVSNKRAPARWLPQGWR
jgi:hypothetical protein